MMILFFLLRCFFCLQEVFPLHLDAPLPCLLELASLHVLEIERALRILDLLALDFVELLAVVFLDFGGETWREEVLGVSLEDGVDGFEWDPNEARIVTYKYEGNIYFLIKLIIEIILKRSLQALTAWSIVFWRGCQNNSVRETIVLSTNGASTNRYSTFQSSWIPSRYIS